MANCESCGAVGEVAKATTKRNGENLCADCAADVDSRKARIVHACDECNTEIEGEYCADHPNATISSIRVVGA